MFCPKCRSEYREGFLECSDCQISLVSELPSEPEPELEEEDFVTIFETSNPDLLTIIKSILEDADISYVTKGESLQDLFGRNPFLGPIEIQVTKEQEYEARNLLTDIEEHPSDES